MALQPCASCGRHVRSDLAACPFCTAPVVAGAARASFSRVSRMAAIGAAAVSLGACAETPKNTVEIHSDPTATATATTTATHAVTARDAAAPDPDLDGEFDPRHRHHGGGPCGPNGQCPPYGGAPPFDYFV